MVCGDDKQQWCRGASKPAAEVGVTLRVRIDRHRTVHRERIVLVSSDCRSASASMWRKRDGP